MRRDVMYSTFQEFYCFKEILFMKKKICFGILLLITIVTVAVYIDSYYYRQAMCDVNIIRYIAGSGSGYSTVCLTAIVPAEAYSESSTVKMIRRYVKHRNREVPDILRIMLYDSMETLSDGDCYLEVTFRKE